MPNGVSAVAYHERTKHTLERVRSSQGLDFGNQPRPDKRYRDLPRIDLDGDIGEPSMPALRAIAGAEPDTPAVDRTTLADLCYYAAGITKMLRRRGRDQAFRAAACTGALYHVDLYPVCGDLDGLDAGVYHFDPRGNALDRLRAGDYRGVLAAAARAPSVEHAPVTFVATSTWWRNAWKYRERTYRHAFWDSGTILANLLATASARGRPAEVVTGFADDAVATLLGLDPAWEAPLELVAVGAGDRVPPSPSVDSIDPQTAPLASDPEDYPVIHAAWRASVLDDGADAERWREAGDRPLDGRGPGEGDRRALDPADMDAAADRSLADTVRRRGSCRRYRRDPVTFRAFSTVLDRAIRGAPMDVRDDGGPALQLVDCYCIVTAVEGVDPGVYQLHPDDGDLELLRTGAYREDAGRLALGQRLGADAAVNVYLLADLDAVTNALGDRGYRVAQLEAAITAGRLYLATYARDDLGGTGLTFFDELVTAFLEPRAAGQTPMFLYTFGRPP